MGPIPFRSVQILKNLLYDWDYLEAIAFNGFFVVSLKELPKRNFKYQIKNTTTYRKYF